MATSIESIIAGQQAILDTWRIHEVKPYPWRNGPEDFDYDYVDRLAERLKESRAGRVTHWRDNGEE